MDAIDLALRKCLHVLASSVTITERKRNVETFVELLADNRTHALLDKDTIDENHVKRTLTWNELFNAIREYTVNELTSVRAKPVKGPSPDSKYQEALKLFKAFLLHADARGPQLDTRSLIDSLISILTSDAWSSCEFILKELSRLLINNVLSLHKYASELREQEWIDLCKLYMTLYQNVEKNNVSSSSAIESDRALYCGYLQMIVKKCVVYTDLDSIKSSIREDLLDFFRIQLEQIKNSNHFSLVENLLCSLNLCSFKYVFDLSNQIFALGTTLLPSILSIWRKKCNDMSKNEIIKFCRLQMSLHHPCHLIDVLDEIDDIWMKNVRDMNDLILREFDEICQKQRSTSRQNQMDFTIRSDLLYLASEVFYQLSSNESSIKTETMDIDGDDLFEPSAKRTRYDLSMSISTNAEGQMKSFKNLFQSVDAYHQAAGFQIISLQLERDMKLPSADCVYYMMVLDRYLAEERRSVLLVNALRCLHLLITHTSHCQLTSDLIARIQPLLHISACESLALELLSNRLSLSQLVSSSSIVALEHLLHHKFSQISSVDEDSLLKHLIPDISSLYRNSEHDLSHFFTAHSLEHTQACAAVLMQLCSFDPLPHRSRIVKKTPNEFDRIEHEWTRMKLLAPAHDDEEIDLDFSPKSNTYELNKFVFRNLLEIYEKNVRFIQQLKEKHLGERNKIVLHLGFLGVNMIDILQIHFVETIWTDERAELLRRLIESVEIIFAELTEETNALLNNTDGDRTSSFMANLLAHIRHSVSLFSSSSLLKPALPSSLHSPSVLYAFIQPKFLSYLHDFAMRDSTTDENHGERCPMDGLIERTSVSTQAFELLIILCLQAVHDQQHSTRSIYLRQICPRFQTTLDLLVRLLDEKLYSYVEELSLVDPASFHRVYSLLSYLCSNHSYCRLHLRTSDLELIGNLFREFFRLYLRDVRTCEGLLCLFEQLLHRLVVKTNEKTREQLTRCRRWLLLKKMIDAFWQKTIATNSVFNARARMCVVRIKRMIVRDEIITTKLADEFERVLHDTSYLVRAEAIRLCLTLFYETEESSLMETKLQGEQEDDNGDDDDSPLGTFLGSVDISQGTLVRDKSMYDRRLQSSDGQEVTYQRLLTVDGSSVTLLCQIARLSEYLARRVAFHLIELGHTHKLSTKIIKRILPVVPIESLLQGWHQDPSYKLTGFPWNLLSNASLDQYGHFIFCIYFLSPSLSHRQQLQGLFDIKSSLIQYFAEMQAYLLPLLANNTKESEQAGLDRQTIEKTLSKTEYNRLIKQKLTNIIACLLLTYWNDEPSFQDPWLPEPILPSYSWSALKSTFDFIKQMMNAKTFIALLIKSTDLGEILLSLSSPLFSTDSIHEQLRLLTIFSLFLTEILLNHLDQSHLPGIVRDATYILLRYLEKNRQAHRTEFYQRELNGKILNLICALLRQLCMKGLDAHSHIFLDHSIDIVLVLIDQVEHLTKERIQPILALIYQFARQDNDPKSMLICHAIEKLRYLTSNISLKKSISVSTSHYFSLLAVRRSSTPVEWLLNMFNDHLDREKHSTLDVSQPLAAIVKRKLMECMSNEKQHSATLKILAGKCLAKCSAFTINEQEEEEEEEQDEQSLAWIINDLTLYYLIDNDQRVVECARRTLKNILSSTVGQDLYNTNHDSEDPVRVYTEAFSSQTVAGTKTDELNLRSSSNPWLLSSSSSFDTWLISLVDFLLEQIRTHYIEENETGHPYALIFVQLDQLVRLKLCLAEQLVPHLIYALLLLPVKLQLRQDLSEHIQSLLEQLLAHPKNTSNSRIRIARILFRTINYLRQCPKKNANSRHGSKSLDYENNFWLEFDYFQLAQCASKYGANRSALIYADIWTTMQRSLLPDNTYESHLYSSDIDLVSRSSTSPSTNSSSGGEKRDKAMHSSSDLIELFVRMHSNLSESDDFYGLDRHFTSISDRSGLCAHAEFHQVNNRWCDALFLYDRAAPTIDSSKLIQSLRFCGFNHVLEQYLAQLSSTSASDGVLYRIQLTSLLSRNDDTKSLTQWSTINDEQPSNNIRQDILSIMQRQMRVPSSSTLQLADYSLWSKVSSLRECRLVNVIDDLATNYQNPQILSTLWSDQAASGIKNNFDQNDELLLTRVAAVHTLLPQNKDEEADIRIVKQSLLENLVTQLCQNALDHKKLQLCDRYVSDLASLFDSSSHELSFLRAKVLVLRQQDTAGEYLRQILSSLDNSQPSAVPNSVVRLRCQLLLCDWLVETRSDTPLAIRQQLESIVSPVDHVGASRSLIFEAYLAMARFSDGEYQRLHALLHSPMFENKRALIARNLIERDKQMKLDPVGRYTKVLQRSTAMDEREIAHQEKIHGEYLLLTLQNYLKCLNLFVAPSSATSSKTSLKKQLSVNNTKSDMITNNSVPEIMIASKCLSYWVTNSNNKEVNARINKELPKIPTHFFLPFVYQMAARMALPMTTSKSETFHSILFDYLSRCVTDHPHHVLPVIFALANAHKDANIQQGTVTSTPPSRSKKDSSSPGIGLIPLNDEISNDARSRAAQQLLDKCAKTKPHLVDQMRKLNDAYIEAAYWDVTGGKTDPQTKAATGKVTLPKNLRLMHIKDFHEVAVPTINIPVANDGVYENIETVSSFHSECLMVGGINAPKKLICHGSTGRKLSQLLKGKDDLRQDAVMQQLFTVVNRLLDKDDLTRHRALNIRTYKVVPLTQKSGVLEWCEGTITFGDYLITDTGAHVRHHPDDWTAIECRRHFQKAANAADNKERLRAFTQACTKLRPVFRYFFYEHYSNASVWHARKQAYAKSVATSSIVGYIVGLGDRHVQNILIDKQTAEVIHIDLGVAFDQGKMLPIPEMIPFRLTRDVIDGLGMCGTEGLFRKSCEITLELMRQYADTLATIIEVFLYDPLYQWQLSPQKALQLQQQLEKNNSDSVTTSSHRSSAKGTPAPTSASIIREPMTTDTNKMAERLLLNLRQKLQGVEGLNQMTVKAHVSMLIQEATSIEHLSRLFAGWQPYL